MFGLDDHIAALSSGGSVLIVLLVATLLGLRHATDPDHIAAVTALVASGRGRATRRAAELGVFWGLGHALTLVLFGLPILLFEAYLPDRLQQGAETAVAALIVFLAVRLLVRWRSGYFHLHAHAHSPGQHDHTHKVRTPFGAFGIGLVHGMGGSAGVGVLLLAAIPSQPLAVTSLVILALFTAVSMTALTTGFGATLGSAPFRRSYAVAIPALGTASLAFGCWYAAAVWSLMPYPLRPVDSPACPSRSTSSTTSGRPSPCSSPARFGYYAGGAADEEALAGNVDAWRRLRLRPRVLVDVTAVSTETTVLGTPVSMPLLVAPTAIQRLAHPDGEAGMARAAAAAGTVMCLSTIATATPADVATAAPDGPRWFQLYVFRERGVTRELIAQAVEHGYSAIVLTVDAPGSGAASATSAPPSACPRTRGAGLRRCDGRPGRRDAAGAAGGDRPGAHLATTSTRALVLGLAAGAQGDPDGRGRRARR